METRFRDGLMAELERRRMPLAELARRAHVSPEQLKKLKQRDTVRTNVDDAVRLASALGTTVEALCATAHVDLALVAGDALARTAPPRIDLSLPSGAPFLLRRDFPGFDLCRGDWLAVDLSRDPRPGDVVVVSFADEDTGEGTQELRRFLDPWLADHHGTAGLLRIDSPNVAVMGPVVAVFRDLTGAAAPK